MVALRGYIALCYSSKKTSKATIAASHAQASRENMSLTVYTHLSTKVLIELQMWCCYWERGLTPKEWG
jgi:hypothetical protein